MRRLGKGFFLFGTPNERTRQFHNEPVEPLPFVSKATESLVLAARLNSLANDNNDSRSL